MIAERQAGPITFTVRGIPAPQGSKRAVVHRSTGRAVVIESSTRVKPWRSDVRDAALATMAWLPPLQGPVGLELAFRFPRPKGHFGTGRNAGVLRANAPIWPAVKPDIDKLARSTLDALTGLLFVDDAQVVDLGLRKRYADGDPPGVTVTVNDLSAR